MQEAQDQAGALAEQGAGWSGPEAQGMSRPDGKARQLEAMRAEIEQLRAQLGEAEETLRAIREGEVDAIVVSGSQGDQVFSLTGAESVYRLIVETMKEAALTVTTDGRILFCNAQFSAFVQTPPERILGRPLAEFVAPDSRALVASLLARSQEASVKRRLVFQGSEGPPLPAHVSATALYQADSLSICLVATDLTELEASTELLRLLQREQEALRASETEFRAFFDTAAVGATELDLDGRFVRVNDRYCELTGFSREELLGMTPADLAPPEDRAVDQARVAAQLRESSTVFEVEKRYVRKDGRVIWVRVSAAPIRDAAGRPLRSAGVIQDITERKRAEEQLRQSAADLAAANAELAVSLREKELLLQEVHHRVKNNLQLISSLIGLQDDALADPAMHERLDWPPPPSPRDGAGPREAVRNRGSRPGRICRLRARPAGRSLAGTRRAGGARRVEARSGAGGVAGDDGAAVRLDLERTGPQRAQTRLLRTHGWRRGHGVVAPRRDGPGALARDR